MLSSLRLILLARVANLLGRWLHGVTAQLPQVPQLEPASPPTPPVQRPAADPRRPAPPDHWVELVQQYAPHLLEPAEPDETALREWPTEADLKRTADDSRSFPEGKVVDYRTRAPKTAPTADSLTNVRPAPLLPSAPRPVDVAQRRSASKRPLRLDQVSTRPLDAETVAAHSAQPDAEPVEPSNVTTTVNEVEQDASEWRPFAAEQIEPSLVKTTVRPVEMADALHQSPLRPVDVQKRRVSRLFSALHLRRHKPTPTPSLPVDVEVTRREREAFDLPARRSADTPAQPVRAIPTQASARESLPTHFSPSSFEQQRIREIGTSIPNGATVPTIRTSAGQAPRLHQERTGIPSRPSAPAQTVLRSTLPSLNLEGVTPDRWPSLPDDPAEAPHDPSAERQRRERLKREQEGGAWSE